MSNKSLEAPTPLGLLSVETYGDPAYPGFTLFADGKQVAVFEYNSNKSEIHLHVWTGDENSEPKTTVLKTA